MKAKVIVFCFLLGVIYTACEDSIGRVGLGSRPDEDKVNVFDTTVFIGARTIEVDSLYAKTTNGLLGEFYDPTYGNIKSSYMCQFYPAVGFPYLDSIVDNRIDSVKLNVYFYSYIGDSVAPMEISVYPVVKPLKTNYYTNTDPKDYCDMNHPMGKYSYTARNFTISDSLKQAMEANGYPYFISIPLPAKFGQDYLDKVMNNELKTVDAFLDFFPGVYLTTTYGTGNLLAVNMTDIILYYQLNKTYQDAEGNDSVAQVPASAAFIVTKEVIQLNKFENKNPADFFNSNSEKMYLKTPAGVFTELTIPIKEIVKGIGRMKFSSVGLYLKAYPADDWAYKLPFPGTPTATSGVTSGSSAKLLLIEPDSVKNFFEMKKVADGQTSYTTQFNSSTYTYNFSNIANVVQNAIDKAPDKDLKLWVIPVQTTWVQDSNYGTIYDYLTTHYFYPSAVTLRGGKDDLKVRVIASDLTIHN